VVTRDSTGCNWIKTTHFFGMHWSNDDFYSLHISKRSLERLCKTRKDVSLASTNKLVDLLDGRPVVQCLRVRKSTRRTSECATREDLGSAAHCKAQLLPDRVGNRLLLFLTPISIRAVGSEPIGAIRPIHDLQPPRASSGGPGHRIASIAIALPRRRSRRSWYMSSRPLRMCTRFPCGLSRMSTGI